MNIHGGKGQARPSPTCADPGSFARGGPTLTTFFMREKRIQIALKVGHHLPTSETPFKLRPTMAKH